MTIKKYFYLALFLFCQSLFSLTWEETRKLKVLPVSEYFFTGQNCEFDLRIPDLDSNKVTLGVNTVSATTNLQKNKNFVSMKKEEFLDENGKRGTIVRLIYNFSETGSTNLPPLDIYLRGVRYRFPFSQATIYENPATIQCEVFSDIEKRNIKLGERIDFTVYIKFALQVLSFSCELPKNSIFEEKERFEVLIDQKADHNFSPEPSPLASFSWTPLTEGEFELPKFKIVATNYNGSRSEPKIHEENIVVKKDMVSESELKAEKKSVKYSDSFWKDENSDSTAFLSDEENNAGVTEKDDTIPVFTVPEKKAKISARISPKTKFKITDETKNYYLIKAGNIFGWIEKNSNLK